MEIRNGNCCRSKAKLKMLWRRAATSRRVVIITFAYQSKGPRFETRRKHLFVFFPQRSHVATIKLRMYIFACIRLFSSWDLLLAISLLSLCFIMYLKKWIYRMCNKTKWPRKVCKPPDHRLCTPAFRCSHCSKQTINNTQWAESMCRKQRWRTSTKRPQGGSVEYQE